MKKNDPKLEDYVSPANSYAQLSLQDLLGAREQYHVQLMEHANVVATAIGRYRIRKTDGWPNSKGPGKVHGRGVRTLENSEVRPYSWPAILVFVNEWIGPKEIENSPEKTISKTFFLPDGRKVPVCIIEAPKELKTDVTARDIRYPLNNIGGGSPVIADVQGRQYVATIACLVGDGHRVYGLTNRHVTGEAGEPIFSRLGGKVERVGVSAGKQLTREGFTKLYPGMPGKSTYVNLDVGLIDIDNLDLWTATVGDRGEEIGPMVDISIENTLTLIGCQVRGSGAASGEMFGEIHGLFYRYKTLGGFEYVADLLIGPKTTPSSSRKNFETSFSTHPGDSGTLWLLEPHHQLKSPGRKGTQKAPRPKGLPLAMQWGRNMLYSAEKAAPQSYVLATFLSRVCAELGVDPIRTWNTDQPDTWGAIGHFSIANRTQVALSGNFPKLVTLMRNNAAIISHDDQTILEGDFKGMGSNEFVALADVPDFFWKPRIAKQGFSRPFEGPNHFADMDQKGPDGRTLLDLCRDPAFVDANRWSAFYDSVVDLLKEEAITPNHRGLLPFRVWQIFDEMVSFAGKGKAAEFVCAAGVLTHYLGDACQPLHISYLHDGDPLRKYEYTFKKGKKEGETEMRPLGNGVHSAYEDEMVNAFREQILDGLKKTPVVDRRELLKNGREAAIRTVAMMRATFDRIAPADIVDAFIDYEGAVKDRGGYMWKKFGKETVNAMQDGAHLLAVLWESAWNCGDGEKNVTSTRMLTEKEAMKICSDGEFLPSLTIDQISSVLKIPTA